MSQFKSTIDLFEQALEKYAQGDLKEAIKANIVQINATKLNILVVGATGVGKSSTINAIFNMDIAKVEGGGMPETQEITSYHLKHTVIWDTPGLGDSEENDERFAQMIENKLQEKDENGNGLIDLVLCILDGSHRDLGTTYTLLKNHIIPYLKEEPSRLIIAINKADMARSGQGWDNEKNCPDEALVHFLDEKVVEPIRKRLLKETGIATNPIYYSAGYIYNDKKREPYNISKLLNTIITHIQEKKRAVILRDINKNSENFKKDDGQSNYNENTQEKADEGFFNTLKKVAGDLWSSFIDFLKAKQGQALIFEVGKHILKNFFRK